MPREFPPSDLGQAILETIARVTGRAVTGSMVTAFAGYSLEVACVLDAEDAVAVTFREDAGPMALFADDQGAAS
jgi:hypothetical protein